jgi:hypothetical protein
MQLTKGLTKDRKRKKQVCLTAYCSNRVFVSRDGKKSSFCSKHRRVRQKETDPVGYYFDALRQNAKRRGIFFCLTKHDFGIFCADTGYLRLKGRFKDCLSIDRINPNLGYQVGNLQVLKVGENVRKRFVDQLHPDSSLGWKEVEVDAF